MYQVRGLSLHDLRFRGQRIVYKLATQELYVSYNGYGGASDQWQMSAEHSCQMLLVTVFTAVRVCQPSRSWKYVLL